MASFYSKPCYFAKFVCLVLVFYVVARIALVKPDKARAIEDMIINAARRGAIGEKVTEERLIDLLEQVSEKNSTKTKVTIQRRRAFDDDDY